MEVINYDAVNKQYYFKMDYKCKRKSYVQDDGNPQKLQDLLEYMLESDWNFLWDKGAINDITPEGLVSDVDLTYLSQMNYIINLALFIH